MEKAIPIEIDHLGTLNGRDCIYLDTVQQNDIDELTFEGDINGSLVSKRKEYITGGVYL